MRFYFYQVAIAFDQLINALHGGWADETISSRAYRLQHRWPYCFYKWLIDLLFFWDADHCRNSYASEKLRLQSPPEFRSWPDSNTA